MTAIAGAWRLDGAPRAADACARMLAAQAAFGPHAVGQWDDGDIALGRRLFRVLPEDLHDRGPAPLPDGGWLVADLRLDNRDDLEPQLGIGPEEARLTSDVAVLARAWARWGEDCFEHIIGDYAFALWDTKLRRLLLARDPFGHRPLHFHRSGRLAAFASMPRGLHALAEIPIAPDEARLAAFLDLRPETGSGTFFEGVERVEPGGLAIIGQDRITIRRHYVPRRQTVRLSGPDPWVEGLREQLDRSVKARLRGAEGCVGAHLSSGWDSAAVAATSARLLAASGGRVTAFTAAPREGYAGPAPPGRHGDESVGAASVAALYENMDHVVLRSDGRSPLADLDRDIAMGGRPVLNPCNQLWFNDINRAARQRGLRVVLTGDFGNLGLTDDGLDALPFLAVAGEWRRWAALAMAARRGGALRWRGVLAASFPHALPAPVWALLRRLFGAPADRPEAYSALGPAARAALPPAARAAPGDVLGDRLATLTRMDLGLSTKGVLGAYGVDLRDPLTDTRLIEFCHSAPIEELIRDGRPRALARRALADRLPAGLLAADSRGFQAADWHEGLTSDRAGVERDLARLSEVPMTARLLDLPRMRALAARWPVEGWERGDTADAYRRVLLRGLAVGRFVTQTLGVNV